MVKDLIGYRFSPTGEELVNHYLKNKNLGNTCLVDEAISEINILNYIPEDLPGLAKIQSDDLKWYFFSRIEYRNAKKKAMKRSTGSGFWKPTGKDRIIRDKRRNGVEVGLKKTVRYYEGRVANGVWTPWVMHEYHITCLPHDQRTYVICKVKKKDIGGDIRSGGNYSSEPSPSLVSDSNTIRAMINTAPEFQVEQQPGQDLLLSDQDSIMQEEYRDDMLMNTVTTTITTASEFEQPGQEIVYGLSADELRVPINEQVDLFPPDAFDPNTLFSDYNHPNLQQQTPYIDDYWSGLLGYNGGNFEDVFSDQEFIM